MPATQAKRLLVLTTLLFLLAAPTSADASDSGAHPGHAAAFGGVTIHHGHVQPTVGVEGEWRPGERPGTWGIGSSVEAILADHTLGVAVLFAALHPWRGLKFTLGGGVEFSADTVHPLARAGFAYDFHLGPVSVTPIANLDYVDQSIAQVYGLAVGFGF